MLSLRVHATSPHPFLDCGLLLETPVARAARARVAEVYARGRRDEGRAALYVGLSPMELIELLNLGDVHARLGEIMVFPLEGHPDVRAVAAQSFAYVMNDGPAPDQRRRARADAWARGVTDLIEFNDAGVDVTGRVVQEFLVGARAFHSQMTFHPSVAKLAGAASAFGKDAPRAVSILARRLCITVPKLSYLRKAEREVVHWGLIRDYLRHFPGEAGVTLALDTGAVLKTSWRRTGPSHIRRVDLADVVMILPNSEAERMFLDQHVYKQDL